MGAGGYQKYMKQGGVQGGSTNASNASSGYQKYMGRYAKGYAGQSPDAPAHAGDCHTIHCLKRWRKAKKQQMHAYIPKEYQASSDANIDNEFEENKARILAEESANRTNASE